MESPHIGPERLAAFLDHQLAPVARDEVVAHFAECATCRHEMTAMRQLLQGRSKRRAWYIVTPLLVAAAATIVFAVAPRVGRLDDESARSIRSAAGITPADQSPTISMISPPEDAVIAERRATFVWGAVGSDATYSLTLQDSTGAAVWATTAADTTAVLPDSVRLAPGEYFWSVAARLPDARSAKTGVRRFLAR